MLELNSNFDSLTIPLPPMLTQMVGVVGDFRYFAIFYLGSKATWSDGRGLGTFSYYAVYQPLIEHFTLALALSAYHLGSDDDFPSHAIVCDRCEGKMYVGNYVDVENFLDSQHPPLRLLSPEEVEKEREVMAQELANFDIERFQKLGMFEFVAGHNSQQRQDLIELVQWLDTRVTQDLLLQYIELAKQGNWLAISMLKQLQERIGITP